MSEENSGSPPGANPSGAGGRHPTPASGTSDRLRVGIVGVSGYSGMELARLVARHPRFRLTFVTTDRWMGRRLGERIAVAGDAADLPCLSQEDGRGRFGTVDVVFLCTPAEVSVELAPRAITAGARVVDLSGGFRLPAADYPRWYGFEHPQPRLLAQAVYSMPEVTGDREKLRQAVLVANPGCYPTAAVMAVLPLLRAGLIDPGSLIIDAKSGTTGAGRKATEEMSFTEVADDVRAYRLLRHQHQPEIERVLGLGGASGAKVTFAPHLLPVRRGILATAYGRLRPEAGRGDVAAAVARAQAGFAEGRPFVRVLAPEEVTLHATVGTNRVALGARADESRGVVVALASIDNLVKGAAGQAIQNANLMFGLPETTGLLDLVGHIP
jgi:N-acetyl-gamma-glutamyl-phosphate reductase